LFDTVTIGFGRTVLHFNLLTTPTTNDTSGFSRLEFHFDLPTLASEAGRFRSKSRTTPLKRVA
jgi:hypothetical protein